MNTNKIFRDLAFRGCSRVSAAVVMATMLALTVVSTQLAQAQQFKVIYNLNTFYGSGSTPWAGVTIDRASNLYVTTKGGGGSGDFGTVFMLSPSPSSAGWSYSPVYAFGGGNDGANPYDRVVFGPDGNLYGATASGGGAAYCSGFGGCGTVFKLNRQGGSWQETVLYRFQGGNDGLAPYSGDLVFDQAGNLYGTTSGGGYFGGYCSGQGCGIVYKLTASGEDCRESILYSFGAGDDCAWPTSGVVFDNAGDLYGLAGPAAYELSPSGSGWTERTIHQFTQDQGGSFGGLIFDGAGNLYGATYYGGLDSIGTVFELKPLGGDWTYSLLHSFSTMSARGAHPLFGGPMSSLTIDAHGNLYGTTYQDGRWGWGSVFKLTPSGSGWTYTSLHDFCKDVRPCIDGANPAGGVTLDANGNLYGTAEYGGTNSGGVVWEITP